MGGYVTQARDLGTKVPRSEGYLNGAVRSSQFNNLVHQVTTSYRDRVDDLTPTQLLQSLKSESSKKVFRPMDTGHTFTTEKTWQQASFFNLGGNASNFMRGHIYPFGINTPTLPTLDANAYGNRAIVSCAPNRPVASIYSLVQDVVETRILLDNIGSDGALWLPNLFSSYNQWLKGREHLTKAVSRSYIEAVFGWAPFIRDIVHLANAVVKSRDLIQQMQRDNGRQVRRRFYFPDLHSTSVLARTNTPTYGNGGGSASSTLSPNVLTGFTGATSSVTSYEKIWFSGSFSYFLKAGNGLNERLDRYAAYAQHLLGIKLTPDVIWNLAPWSWLVDWNVDVSSALQAASLQANDGLVVNYGYLMRESSTAVKDTILATGVKSGKQVTLFGARYLKRKERFRSTPFGFGVNPNSFSNEQWAILAALGFLKAPKTLW